jgi:putative membrane protein
MIATVLVVGLALLHFYILILEMFLWDKPMGRKAFGTTPEFSATTKTLAANQGLYNGFLAVGLLWGLSQGAAALRIQAFFVICVVIAGIYGALTSSIKILFIQAIPGALCLAALLAGI